MNILLFAPGLLMVLLDQCGLLQTIALFIEIIAIQVKPIYISSSNILVSAGNPLSGISTQLLVKSFRILSRIQVLLDSQLENDF
jgi:hypothetical protein